MTAKKIGYWTATALTAFVLLTGGAAQLARRPENVEGMIQLGYPVYLLTILGIWKILGGVAILAPRFPRLKEWAYAGTIFDLTGASASHAFHGDVPWHVVVPLVLAALAFASWALRPASRTLGALLPSRAGA